MSIIKRFGKVMSYNIGQLFTKGDTTEKEVNEYLDEIEKDLQSIKVESATLMEEEKRKRRSLNECIDEKYKIERYIKKAEENREYSRAREFEESLNTLQVNEKILQDEYNIAKENCLKLQQMEGKLRGDLLELKSKMNEVKNTLNKAGTLGGSGTMEDKISTLQDKADRKLFEAEALEELNNLSSTKAEDEEFERLFKELEES